MVQVSFQEYQRSKKSILRKIRHRLLTLGIVIGLLALAAIILGVVR